MPKRKIEAAPAVLGRDKRQTAGKRMSTLVGEELDKDESFWGHDTWDEDGEESEYSESTGEGGKVVMRAIGLACWCHGEGLCGAMQC